MSDRFEPLDFLPDTDTVNYTIQQIGPRRIVEMWENKSAFATLDCTEGERGLLMAVWRTIPNPASCLMTGYWHLYAESKKRLAMADCKDVPPREQSRRSRNDVVAKHIDGDGTIRDVHLS